MGEIDDQHQGDWIGPEYQRAEEIDPLELLTGLNKLELFADDTNMQMQAFSPGWSLQTPPLMVAQTPPPKSRTKMVF